MILKYYNKILKTYLETEMLRISLFEFYDVSTFVCQIQIHFYTNG